MSNLRKSIGLLAVALLLATQCAIFALTEQTVTETAALSNAAYEAVTSGAESSSGAESESSMSSAPESTQPLFQTIVEWALGKADIRKWAHTFEFLLTGLFP